MKVSPSIREVSTAASGPTSPSHPTTADATTEVIQNRSRGKYTAKERTAREVPRQVRQADQARYRAQSELKTTEKEIRPWMLDDPGPRPIGTGQSLHPVIIMKMTPNPAEQSGSTASHSIKGCKKGGSCLRKGHLSPMRVLLRQMRIQRDSLATATSVLVEAV